MKKLAIVGSGDLGQQIAYHAAAGNHYEMAGYFDDFEKKGSVKKGLPVLGSINDVMQAYEQGIFEVLMVGIGYHHFAKRREVFTQFKGKIPFANLVHSSSYIDPSCKIGEGIFVYPGCVVDMASVLEDNVLLNAGCIIAHDSHIGFNSMLAPGVNIAGFVRIGMSVHLGIGTIVIDGTNITDDTRTGAGAVVVNNLEEPGLYVGIPAKKIK